MTSRSRDTLIESELRVAYRKDHVMSVYVYTMYMIAFETQATYAL